MMSTIKPIIDWRIVMAGIAALAIIEVAALFNGIDGVLLSTIIAIIAFAIGVTVPNPIKK